MAGIQGDHQLRVAGLHEDVRLDPGVVEAFVRHLPQLHGRFVQKERKIFEFVHPSSFADSISIFFFVE